MGRPDPIIFRWSRPERSQLCMSRRYNLRPVQCIIIDLRNGCGSASQGHRFVRLYRLSKSMRQKACFPGHRDLERDRGLHCPSDVEL